MPVPIDRSSQVPFIPAGCEEEVGDTMASTIGPFQTDTHLLRGMMVDPIPQDGMLNNNASFAAGLLDRAEFHTGFGHLRHPMGVPRPTNHEINAVSHRRTRSAGLYLPRPCVCGRFHGSNIDHSPYTIRGPTIVVFQPLSRRAIFCYVLFFSLQSVLIYFCSRISDKR